MHSPTPFALLLDYCVLVSGNYLFVCGSGGEHKSLLLVEHAEIAQLSCTVHESLAAKAKGVLRTLWLGQGKRPGIQTAVGLPLSDMEAQLLQFSIYMMRVKTVHLPVSWVVNTKVVNGSIQCSFRLISNLWYDRVISVLALYVLTFHSNSYCVARARKTSQFTQSVLFEIFCSRSVCAGTANKEKVPHYKFISHTAVL